MNNWKAAKFGDVFDLIYRYPTYFGIEYVEFGVKEIRGELLTHTGHIVDDCRFISQETANSFPKVSLEKDDLIMSVRGTLGKVGLVTEKHAGSIITANLLRLSPNRSIADSKWLLQIMTSEYFQAQLELVCSQTTIKTIQVPQLAKISLRLPSVVEQRKISIILETVDNLIEKTHSLIAKYNAIKQGMMQDLFTRGIDEKGALRLDCKESPNLYVQSAIGPVPNSWETMPLLDIYESLIDGPFGSNLKTEHYVDEPGIRVIRLQNIGTSTYNDDDKAYVSNDHASALSRHEVLPGDVLIAALGEDSNAVGRACSYPPYLPPAINKADCFRLRCNPETMLNAFAMLSMNSDYIQTQIRTITQGVTRVRVNLNNLKTVQFKVPPINEQKRIIDRIDTITQTIQAENNVLHKFGRIKSGLMQDLLTGKVRVNVNASTESTQDVGVHQS